MADGSKIEWTDATWIPIRARNLKTGKVGWHCEHATTGCEFCYSEGFNKRLGTGLPFKPGHRKDIELFLDDKMLLAPLRWKKPRMIFVCSMTDLFADFVSDEWIDQVFAVMALCPQHTFQVLTKRAQRMREYCASDATLGRVLSITNSWLRDDGKITVSHNPDGLGGIVLPNVWLGVSAERQQEADERIPLLLQTPAAVRFISAEPLLGPVNLAPWLHPWGCSCGWGGAYGADLCEACGHVFDGGTSETDSVPCPKCGTNTNASACPQCHYGTDFGPNNARLDWVIVGGESGTRARPMHPDWARSLRDQCAAAGVAFFFKQWGNWKPLDQIDERAIEGARGPNAIVHRDGRFVLDSDIADPPNAVFSFNLGKKRAGRLLDGKEHNEMPATAAARAHAA